ncbi:ImmA/IrrE family metallo-endopeptidase [Prescottella equi]|uniref:ImmA/IrrE family metallo-endopeptidase n=1 Tax=Rhodococcus hoagii TaxID=43767 RepID=UPI000B3D7835|nr:ImmA/IrrE family metallo-endopeptidase [Prescottella equi]
MKELYERAEALGVTVVEVDDLPSGTRGEYIHEERLIKLDAGLSERQKKCTLAHELGHAHHGHTKPQSEAERLRQERQANDYAAQALITADAYAAAEAQYGPHIAALAFHLGVTPAVVRSWRSWWCRAKKCFPIAG